MSAQADTTPNAPTAEKVAETVDAKIAAKLKDDPMHITQQDAARVQSAEHRVLGHRPAHDSVAAQAQSTADKVDSFHKVADAIEKKLHDDPATVTAEDAKHVLSAEQKVLGHFPLKDSISADAQRTAAANERSVGVDTTGEPPKSTVSARRQSITAAEQSHIDREKIFEATAKEMKEKLAKDPAAITEDDAKHMRRVDTRAHGATEKGSLTAHVQSAADKQEGDAKRQDSVTDAAAVATDGVDKEPFATA